MAVVSVRFHYPDYGSGKTSIAISEVSITSTHMPKNAYIFHERLNAAPHILQRVLYNLIGSTRYNVALIPGTWDIDYVDEDGNSLADRNEP